MRTLINVLVIILLAAPCSGEEQLETKEIIVIEEGRHGPITFSVLIAGDGTIEDIAILESSEVKGARIKRRRFLKQFIGKGAENPIRLKYDIDAVTGATVSSQAAAGAARKALEIWKEALSREKLFE